MPSNVIKPIAKRARASVEKAESLWKEAKQYAESRNISNKYAYATAVVKKHLGLKDEDLILNGAPIEEVVSQSCLSEMTSSCNAGRKDTGKKRKSPFQKKKKKKESLDIVMGAIVLSEFCKVAAGQKSKIACLDENDCPSVRPTFYSTLNSLGEKYSIEDLRNLFPGARDEYIAFLSILTEKYSADQLKKLFPNIDQDYVKFLSESELKERGVMEFRKGDLVSLVDDPELHGLIIGVRYGFGGGRQYKVRWRNGEESWERESLLQFADEGDDW